MLITHAIHVGWPALSLIRRLTISGIISAALGALLEFAQSFVPTRSVELLDWLADVAGIIVAAMGMYLLISWILPRARAAFRTASE